MIVLGLNYGPDENPLALLARRERGAISVYAHGDDYHELIKGKRGDERGPKTVHLNARYNAGNDQKSHAAQKLAGCGKTAISDRFRNLNFAE